MAPTRWRNELNDSPVADVTSTSPSASPHRSSKFRTTRAGPSYAPALPAMPMTVAVSPAGPSASPVTPSTTKPKAAITLASADGNWSSAGGGGGIAPSAAGAPFAVAALRAATRALSSSAVGVASPSSNPSISEGHTSRVSYEKLILPSAYRRRPNSIRPRRIRPTADESL